MTDKYILVNSVPTLETDLFAWAHWIERTNCSIAFTRVQEDISVSTVFLGLDHNIIKRGLPLLYETMVFGGPLDNEQKRYTTQTEAEQGHADIVYRIRAILCLTNQ